MNLWISGQLLVAGLFLSSSALTPEECKPLITPLSLVDPQVMYGKLNTIAGYTDHEAFNNILKLTESSWVRITGSPSNPKEAEMYEETRMGGKCYGSTSSITIDGDNATAKVANISSQFNVLPSCDGCLVINIFNCTARDLDKFIHFMNINTTIEEDVISARGVYLMARESTVKDSDLEHFKKQASCLGFSGEPGFVYDTKKALCAEGEAIIVPTS